MKKRKTKSKLQAVKDFSWLPCIKRRKEVESGAPPSGKVPQISKARKLAKKIKIRKAARRARKLANKEAHNG